MTTAPPDLTPDMSLEDILAQFQVSAYPPEQRSLAENLVLSGAWDETVDSMSEDQAKALLYDWEFWQRPDQRPPEAFELGLVKWWFVKSGRGYGKTRVGAEETKKRIRAGKVGRAAIVAPTAGDARDIMVEGESGILAVHPNWWRPHYEPSKRRITWPNGAMATVYSADEPDRLRGPAHDWVWGDEPASWRFGEEAMDNIEFGLRLGLSPQGLLTGTPRPIRWLRDFLGDPDTVVTEGSSFRNLANLAESFIRRVIRKYVGTRLGLQELFALLLEDVEGALWKRSLIDETRIKWVENQDGTLVLPVPDFDRVVIGVDPAGSKTKKSDETSIIGVGRAGSIDEGHCYVLADRSGVMSPKEWGQAVCDLYWELGADVVAAEANMGHDLVLRNIQVIDKRVKVKKVYSSRGKKLRAEPVSTVYERRRVHHVGIFGELETQQTEWVPGETEDSPDRVDGLVHAITELLGLTPGKRRVRIVN